MPRRASNARRFDRARSQYHFGNWRCSLFRSASSVGHASCSSGAMVLPPPPSARNVADVAERPGPQVLLRSYTQARWQAAFRSGCIATLISGSAAALEPPVAAEERSPSFSARAPCDRGRQCRRVDQDRYAGRALRCVDVRTGRASWMVLGAPFSARSCRLVDEVFPSWPARRSRRSGDLGRVLAVRHIVQHVVSDRSVHRALSGRGHGRFRRRVGELWHGSPPCPTLAPAPSTPRSTRRDTPSKPATNRANQSCMASGPSCASVAGAARSLPFTATFPKA